MEPLTVKISVQVLPSDYTCDGEDKSPLITIGGVNTGIAKCLAVIVTDLNSAGGGGFVHWLAWNIELVRMIPEAIPKTPEVAFPLHAVQGTNGFGKIGYNGPCPSAGETHRYSFKVYGLDTELSLPAGAGKEELFAALQGHLVQYGETFVTYGR
jgi:Raf kinase inhibitor-like YbhB/YbcL family protein